MKNKTAGRSFIMIALLVLLVVVTVMCVSDALLIEIKEGGPDAARKEELKKKLISYNARYSKINGKLRLVGSANNGELVVTMEDLIDVAVIFQAKDDVKKLMPYQGKKVAVEGMFEARELIYENPIYNHYRFMIYIEKFELTK